MMFLPGIGKGGVLAGTPARGRRTRPLFAGLAVALTCLPMGLSLSPSTVRAAEPVAPVYPHAAVVRHEYGWGARSYWLFEPAEPTPERAPVVVLHHGWLAVNPGAYGAWIQHLARSGRIVVFPRYQTDVLTAPNEFLANAAAAITDALDVLDTAPGHVRPDREKFALIGHSAGGNLSAQMAAMAPALHLPRPRAVITLMPGEVQPSLEPDLAAIPADTLLVVAVAEDDIVVGDVRARQIFSQTRLIPLSRKKYLLYRTDLHGTPWLVAHHLAPTAAHLPFDSGEGFMRAFQMTKAEVNALDRAGFWRVADITLAAAWSGKSLDEATDRGELFRHLGYWSDGRAVLGPVVGDDLALIPRVFPTNGVRLIQWTPGAGTPAPGTPALPADPVAGKDAPVLRR